MMFGDFVQRFLWPVFWAEFAVFLLPALIVMSKGAVGGLITFVPVLFLLIFAGVVVVSESPALRNLLAGALGLGAWLLIMGFAAFLMDKTRR